MGKRNRERRREKQRKRAAGRPTGGSWGNDDFSGWPRWGDSGRPSSGRPGGWGPGASGASTASPDDAAEIAAAILAAAQCYRLGDEAAYSHCLAHLGLDDQVPGPTRWRALVGQVVVRTADQALAAAWSSGWQPADVERLVRHRMKSSHAAAVVAAIAHQHRRYAAATLTPGWLAQLRALGAEPPEPSARAGEPGVLPLGDPTRGDASIGDPKALIEVLSLLWWLPKLPRLCPLPGEARNGTGGGRAVDARVLERVRALLAKAESTTFSEEAEAFTAKAQELMARHAVDRAMVEGADQGEGPVGHRIGIDDPYAQPKALLLHVVAAANRCRSVLTKDLGFATVFGHESDLDGVDLLYTSLLIQATSALAAAGRRTDGSGRSRTRSFRSSFLIAYADRIGQRLQQSAEAAEAAGAEEHGSRLLPVLAARSQAVDDAIETAFPDMEHGSMSISNGAGWAAGVAAANLARLSARQEVRASRAS